MSTHIDIKDYINEIRSYMKIDYYFPDNKPLNSAPIVYEFDAKISENLPKEYLVGVLERKYRLSNRLANQYVEEYKNFLILAIFSENQLTPSEQVDQVWHIHQFSTKNYRKFCYTVFGELILHSPSDGDDPDKYRTWYKNTLQKYHEVLGIPPARHIWPELDVRFSPKYFSERWVSIYRLVCVVLSIVRLGIGESDVEKVLPLMPELYSKWSGESISECSKRGCAGVVQECLRLNLPYQSATETSD